MVSYINNPDAEGKMEDMIHVLKCQDGSHIKIWFDLGKNYVEVAMSTDAAKRLAETIKSAC